MSLMKWWLFAKSKANLKKLNIKLFFPWLKVLGPIKHSRTRLNMINGAQF